MFQTLALQNNQHHCIISFHFCRCEHASRRSFVLWVYSRRELMCWTAKLLPQLGDPTRFAAAAAAAVCCGRVLYILYGLFLAGARSPSVWGPQSMLMIHRRPASSSSSTHYDLLPPICCSTYSVADPRQVVQQQARQQVTEVIW